MTFRDILLDEIADARARVRQQSLLLARRAIAAGKHADSGRMMNDLGEIQGEANKLDALCGVYAQAMKSLDKYDAYMGMAKSESIARHPSGGKHG